ncbi:hypothetical protein DFH06DRAFT_1125171 [Mycena polygramma]|nr:hypothetical protein DFH06DRAFT_1125171 [Mycena polygramma]
MTGKHEKEFEKGRREEEFERVQGIQTSSGFVEIGANWSPKHSIALPNSSQKYQRGRSKRMQSDGCSNTRRRDGGGPDKLGREYKDLHARFYEYGGEKSSSVIDCSNCWIGWNEEQSRPSDVSIPLSGSMEAKSLQIPIVCGGLGGGKRKILSGMIEVIKELVDTPIRPSVTNTQNDGSSSSRVPRAFESRAEGVDSSSYHLLPAQDGSKGLKQFMKKGGVF